MRYERIGEVDAAAPHHRAARELAKKADTLWGLQADTETATGQATSTKPLSATATPKVSGIVALEASAHRLELLDRMGSDCVALALDTAESDASREKMLNHQLAVTHKVILDIAGKLVFEPDSVGLARSANVMARLMDTYQRGLLVLQRLRTGGEQTIVVRNVTVGEGCAPQILDRAALAVLMPPESAMA